MIKVNDLNLEQGDFVLSSISLTIQQAQYCVLMGHSGSGKTSLMEAICGLRSFKSGSIEIANRDVSNFPPAQRRIAYVPQDGALFPSMKVAEQIAFPQKIQKLPISKIANTVEKLAEQFSISHLLERLPNSLSGGEKQRVALARALAMEPQALCLDEPLSALDEDLHHELCMLLKTIVKERHLTCLHITHNRQEALNIADIAYKIENGKITKFELS